MTPPNTHALDAAMTFLFHIADHWRRASEVDRSAAEATGLTA